MQHGKSKSLVHVSREAVGEHMRNLFVGEQIAGTAIAMYGAGLILAEYFRTNVKEVAGESAPVLARIGLAALITYSQYLLFKRMVAYASIRDVFSSKRLAYTVSGYVPAAYHYAMDYLHPTSEIPYALYGTALLLLQGKNVNDLYGVLSIPPLVLILYKAVILFWVFFSGGWRSPSVVSFVLLTASLLTCVERVLFIGRQGCISRENWVSFIAAFVSLCIVIYMTVFSMPVLRLASS
jgi:hypothetical protein